MNTKPTIKQLNDSWESFLKLGIYQDQRLKTKKTSLISARVVK